MELGAIANILLVDSDRLSRRTEEEEEQRAISNAVCGSCSLYGHCGQKVFEYTPSKICYHPCDSDRL